MITDQIGVTLKYPTLHNIQDFRDSAEDPGKLIEFITNNIENVFDNDNVYDNFDISEMDEFVNSMETNQFEKITRWYASLPLITHEIKWTCPECKKEEAVVLRGLNDFFM